MLDRITIKRFSELSGYTELAIRSKIKNGVWLENLVIFRAPDNRILISLRGYEQWVDEKRNTAEFRQGLKVQSVSGLNTPPPKTGKGNFYNCSPPPLT